MDPRNLFGPIYSKVTAEGCLGTATPQQENNVGPAVYLVIRMILSNLMLRATTKK